MSLFAPLACPPAHVRDDRPPLSPPRPPCRPPCRPLPAESPLDIPLSPLPLPLPQPPTRPLPTRHVSFSLVSSDTLYSLPISPLRSPPVQRRWSSPFHRRKSSAPDSPQPYIAKNPVDQFGRILPSSPPASDVHSSPKSPRGYSSPLRLSFTSKRSVSCTPTLIHLDQVDTRAPSPPSTSATRPSTPLQRPRFVNPFSKHSRPKTLSPPSTFKAPSTPSSNSSGMSSPPARRQVLVNKFKSIFKSIPPEPSPVIHSKPIFTTINTRLRRKPVARTEPYGPPWNAPMPVPDFPLSQHSLQKPAQPMSPSPQSRRKRSVHECSRSEKTSLSPGQISPRTFINELDEKLSLLQQQRIQDLIPSPHG